MFGTVMQLFTMQFNSCLINKVFMNMHRYVSINIYACMYSNTLEGVAIIIIYKNIFIIIIMTLVLMATIIILQ